MTQQRLSFLTTILALCIFNGMYAQSTKDTLSSTKKYTFGVLPAIAFDSDLGFQYGALANVYLHSPNHPYPKYHNSFYAEASRYTAGSSLLRFYWDSKTIAQPFRANFDCTYIQDLTNDFFGFNGAQTLFNHNYEIEGSPDYISRVFYKYDTRMFRAMGNIKGSINNGRWYWVAGLTLMDYTTKPVNTNRLNDMHPSNPLPDAESLYHKYLDWEIIQSDEAHGGFNAQFRGGIGIDTRDNESNPSHGIWSELLVSTIPQTTSSHRQGNMQLTAVHRQYISHTSTKTIFAYRLLANVTPIGETPYYLLSTIPASWLSGAKLEGLGGAKTMRGVRRNRVIGKGIALANIEIRQKLSSFRWKNQDFHIASNIFADGGMVIQNYKVNLSKVSDTDRNLYFSGADDALHVSYGIGLKIAMNENFIVSADFGRAADKQDGNSGLYIDLNYLF